MCELFWVIKTVFKMVAIIKKSNETKKVHIDLLHFALGNDIITENIVESLDDQDLDPWYEACQMFNTNMDKICWKKRARKLADAIRMTIPLEDKWPNTTYRTIHSILRNEVNSRVDWIRGSFIRRDRTYRICPEIIAEAACLTYHGQLEPSPDWKLNLYCVDLSSVPRSHLASLVSYLSCGLDIFNVTGCDLINILDNVKTEKLRIIRRSLNKEETRALVQAMETRVKELGLRDQMMRDQMTLDIRTLLDYSGNGMCSEVECLGKTAENYREELTSWAMDRNWKSTFVPSNGTLTLKKIKH